METIRFKTTVREQLVSITHDIQAIVSRKGWQRGALLVFCPHTTGAITINESADPDVRKDICSFMKHLVPVESVFLHQEGNSDAHLKASMFGAHSLFIVEQGNLMLGTWQGIYFCEWDGPRNRHVWVQFLPGY